MKPLRKNQPKTGKGKTWLGATMAAIAGILLGSVLGVATGVILSSDEGSQSPQLAWNGMREPVNLLVMGNDVSNSNLNPGLTGNTDTMFLLNLDPRTNKVKGLSIPRDTRVPIPGHRTFKINAANPYGGPELSKKTVSQFLTVPVHRYILINTRGLIEAIDAIGGVSVTIPKRVYYQDHRGGLHIDFQKGIQHLTGKEVQEYLRFRHDELGDIGRVQRQQRFLIELADQFLQPAVLLKAPTLLQIIQKNSKTDLGPMEILQLVSFGKNVKGSKNFQMVMVPGSFQNLKGISFWNADLGPIQDYLSTHFRTGLQDPLPDSTPSPHRPTVSIFDGSGQHRTAQAVRKLLESSGYAIREIKRTEKQAETQVIVQRGDVEKADAIIGTLGTGKKVEASIGDIYSDFTIVLGEDWKPAPVKQP